jgi:hypothetical protein
MEVRMAVVAKFRVVRIAHFADNPNYVGADVTLKPVPAIDPCTKDECAENKIFGDATPSGNIEMRIMNPDAIAEFSRAMGSDMTVTFQKSRK